MPPVAPFDPLAEMGASPISAPADAVAQPAAPPSPAQMPPADSTAQHGVAVQTFGPLSWDASGTPFYAVKPGDVAPSGDGTPASAPVPPKVALHMAPDGSMTTLPDAALPEFNKQATPIGGGPVEVASPSPAGKAEAPFDPLAALGASPVAGDTSAAAPQAASAPPDTGPKMPLLADDMRQANAPEFLVKSAQALDTLNNWARGTNDASAHAISLGLDDQVSPAILAGMNAVARESQGQPQDFAGDFDRFQQQQRDRRARFAQTNPVASGVSQIAGGAMLPIAPLFRAAAPAASVAARLGAYAQNVGSSGLVGAAAGFGEGQGGFTSRLQSAENGAEAGLLGGVVIPAAAAIAAPAIRAISSTAGKALALPGRILSSSSQGQTVANQLAQHISPSSIETSPVGPLDLAQATNNPEISAKVDYAKGIPQGVGAAADMKAAQLDAVRNQVGKIGALPGGADMADASTGLVDAVRDARRIGGHEETRLWTVDHLAKEPVTVTPVKSAVKDAISALDPVFQDGMPASIRALVNRLNRAEPTTIRDLNGIRSGLEKIARTSLDPAERSIARTVSDAFLEGMDHIPEIEGRPSVPTGMVKLGEGASSGNVIPESQAHGRQVTPVMSDEIVPNPDMRAAYDNAREYTRQMRGLFDNNGDVGKLLAKVKGDYRKDASEGASVFFNLANGSPEGPKTLAQLSDFIGALKSQPSSGPAAQKLRDAAATYIASALSKASKLGEGQAFSPAALQQVLQTNKNWMETSGILTSNQSKAASDLLNYVKLLRRPEMLKAQINSATNSRSEVAKTFIDHIMNPIMRRVMESATVFASGERFGGAGALAAGVASAALERAVKEAEDAIRSLMAGAVLDSRVGASLVARAKPPGAPMTPQVKALMQTLPLRLQAEISGQNSAEKSTSPKVTTR